MADNRAPLVMHAAAKAAAMRALADALEDGLELAAAVLQAKVDDSAPEPMPPSVIVDARKIASAFAAIDGKQSDDEPAEPEQDEAEAAPAESGQPANDSTDDWLSSLTKVCGELGAHVAAHKAQHETEHGDAVCVAQRVAVAVHAFGKSVAVPSPVSEGEGE